MRIFRYTITTTEYQSVDWRTVSGKILIRVAGNNVRIGYDQQIMAAGTYFTFLKDQTIVLDQPASLGYNELLYMIAEGGDATVEVMITNYGGME
jgi:hypothetical protein